MRQKHTRRAGLTLLETVIVMAIAGILLTLLVAGLVRLREAGSRVESSENLKQIALATQHFATAHNGRLPPLGDKEGSKVELKPGIVSIQPNITRPALFVQVLPYLEQRRGQKLKVSIPFYVSPADPTASEVIDQGISSYAANALAFDGDPHANRTFQDGTSNTIAFAEHYAKCGVRVFYYWASGTGLNQRASFADHGDVVPVTSGQPPTSKPKDYTGTFQSAPAITNCYGGVPQTPHSGGMLTAMADGSVRQISTSISVAAFWGAVTPASGEIPGGDW